jgi:hypothetical protein
VSSEAPMGTTPGDGEDSSGGVPWFATFSLLDVGGAMSPAQIQPFVALLAKLWRRTINKPVRRTSSARDE